MRTMHPVISARASSPTSTTGDPVIRLRLDKPSHWDWQLTTSADALPTVQLLDKGGRLLVETTGRTAQRARGSFKDGLKSHEKFPSIAQEWRRSNGSSCSSAASRLSPGNRNMDGYSTKFGPDEFPGGYIPRKCRSDANVILGGDEQKRERERRRRIRKRHSSGVETAMKRLQEEEDDEGARRNERAATFKRYSAGDYLRRQILDDLRGSNDVVVGKSAKDIARDRCERMKVYLNADNGNDAVSRSNEELGGDRCAEVKAHLQKTTSENDASSFAAATRQRRVAERAPRDEKLRELKEYLASRRRAEDVPKTPPRHGKNLDEIRDFLKAEIEERMAREGLFPAADPTRKLEKRYSDCRPHSDKKNYRARKVRSEANIVRFDVEEDADGPRIVAEERKSRKKNSSFGSDRRKVYRKTKSDVLLGKMGSSAESELSANPPRRIKSQDNVERSWREYKERKRLERMLQKDETDLQGTVEEDFMSKPRWKDLQAYSCKGKDCRVCLNERSCANPLKNEEMKMNGCEDDKVPLENREKAETDATDNERPATQLQENYLLLEAKEKPCTPIVARVQVNRERTDIKDDASSPDFGYNSIQKRDALKNYRELYAKSNVKKSDTFKIVDGSEEVRDDQFSCPLPNSEVPSESTARDERWTMKDTVKREEPLTPQSNEDIAKDYFKRVYELLKRRQEDARRMAEEGGGHEDTSSSNYMTQEQVQRKRRRPRRKKDGNAPPRGDEVITATPSTTERDAWTVQRLLVNAEPANRRPQPRQDQAAGAAKRPRHPAPPPPYSGTLDARDISKYFDSPNKENQPGYDVVNQRRPVKESVQLDRNDKMGSNLSRHSGKGLSGRRTQSSGNLCGSKGKLNNVGKILVPCSSAQKERYKFCGSLPNHLDGKESLKDDDPRENNNVISDTISGNLGGTLPHKKRSLGVHFSDGPTDGLDLVMHRSQDSIEDNPWRYQQSDDLDLVRCKHGNFDLVRRNQNADAVDGDFAGKRYGRGVSLDDRCHRGSDLDLVGTLPKKRQEAKQSQASKYVVDDVDDDLLLKSIHKPDCELLKHRKQIRGADLKLSRLTGGEPQDQGYASERSPEDEHPPSLPGQPFPSVTPEHTFRVILQKSSRGLGLSVSGGDTAGPVRVKRLFPQQPAALSDKLQPGDILLAANGVPLTGLTNYEALEVLRTTSNIVELVVCRPPGEATITPPGAPPPPPIRREPPPPLRLLNPLPPLQIEPCGEFDIEMTKVGGSLGFTLRKADSSALGHYVRALVREPALSDGRIQPGDKIVAVDGAPLSPMSHEEAVALLRQCGPTVRLRLYRDLAQTPVSALSPTEPDHPLRPPRTSLRQEAVDMLCDLAVRKLSPGTSSGSSVRQSPGASCGSPRRLRRPATRTPTAENEKEQESPQKYLVTQMSTTSQADTSDSDQCSIKTQITNSNPNTPVTDIIDPPPLYDVCDSVSESKPARPSFLNLSAPQEKPHFQFSLDSDSEYAAPMIVTESDSNLDEAARERSALSGDEPNNDLPSEPASMPPLLSSTGGTSTAFSYKNPAYQSANPVCGGGEANAKNKAAYSSDQDIPGKVSGGDDPAGSKGLLKWKGVMFTPNDGTDETGRFSDDADGGTTESSAPTSSCEQDNQVFMVELTRGWNSRLGFSLQPEGERTVISVVHADSVAAKDGRLKQGDVLIMVNDESVKHMSTAEIIDLLRKIRGSIGITVMRRSHENPT